MSRRVKGPDGIVRIVPDDATDAEIASMLESTPTTREPAIGAHPEAKMSAGRGGEYFSGLPPAPDLESRADANMFDIGGVGIPPEAALMGMQAGRAVLRAGSGLASRGAELVSQATPFAKYYAVKHALTSIGVPHGVAELAAVGVSGYKRGGAAKAAETEATAPAAGPIPAPSQSVQAPSEAPRTSVRPSPPPTDSILSDAATAERLRIRNPGTALQSAKDAFAKLGETPRPAEASNAGELIRRGVPPETAVAQVIKNRPAAPLSPAEQLAKMPGAMSDAEVRAALDARNARGQIKSPSAQTAIERKAANTSKAWTSESGGELFHGTTDQRIGKFGDQSAIYMTTDAAEAEGYARGVHALGEARGTPVVSKVAARPGKTVDISDKITNAMNDESFDHDWLDAAMNDARKAGARYVTYEHPSNLPGDQMQRVVVALHPKADLVLKSPKVGR